MTHKESTLDLATLEWIKFTFKLYSDDSTQTDGFMNLCRVIDELRKLDYKVSNYNVHDYDITNYNNHL